MLKKFIALIVLTLGLNTAFAYKISEVQVVRYGERYIITFSAHLDAPVNNVKEVIYDFENAAKLTPAVLKTEVYRYDEDTARVTATMRPCVSIFCRTIVKLSIVNFEEDRIYFQGIQNAGSFRNADEIIKLSAEDQGTRLKYKGDFSPGFYLPQWLGTKYIRGMVRKYLVAILNEMENKANLGA